MEGGRNLFDINTLFRYWAVGFLSLLVYMLILGFICHVIDTVVHTDKATTLLLKIFGIVSGYALMNHQKVTFLNLIILIVFISAFGFVVKELDLIPFSLFKF